MDHFTEYNLALNDAARQRRAAELLVREAAATFANAERNRNANRGHRFSIVRSVKAMTQAGGAGLRDGFEAEVAQELARQAGVAHDPCRPMLPWGALLSRVLTVATPTAGGYFVGTGVPTIADALAPWSLTLRAGMTVLPGLRDDVQVPREATGAPGQWLATETTTGTASNPTFGAATLKPKNAIGYVEISDRLLRQGPLADDFIGRALGRSLATLVDQAVISGTSTDSSVPLGLRYQSGVTNVTGTNLSYADLRNEQEQVALGNVQDGAHAWVGHPTVRELLGGRAVGTSAGIAPFVWQDDKILNRPAYVTTDVGTGRIVHGDWGQVIFATWGPGFVLEHNPYANFQAAIHGFRAVLSCDVGVLQTGAVRVLNGIT